MQTYPLITIGIPTYNRARSYLPETLESALAQTYPEIEVVVSDNGSTDDTQAVVKSYDDPRIRYFKQQPPVTPNDNFNFCLQQARGAYFSLLHDDDMIDPDFVETCLQAAGHQTHFGVIRTGVRIINADGMVIREMRNRVTGASTGEFFLAWFENKTSIYLCNTLFNARGLRDIGGLRSRHNLFQDVTAIARQAASSGRVDVEAVKASARSHHGQRTHVARVREWCEDSLDLLALVCELAPERAAELRQKGMRFFANVNYGRTNNIRSPVHRAATYFLVYRIFGRQYLPRLRTVLSSTAAYRGLRQIKRRILGLPAWVD
ncbi:MAG: glycosyltransferase family A protein [Candidatus Poribacteria bacterium]|nr:glycosyltransferase family A protein [Candidatus Poribacteria bacterium]